MGKKQKMFRYGHVATVKWSVNDVKMMTLRLKLGTKSGFLLGVLLCSIASYFLRLMLYFDEPIWGKQTNKQTNKS